MFRRIIVAALLLLSMSFAIDLVSPAISNVQSGAVIDLGTIGPGQTISILLNPIATAGGIYGQGGTYDSAVATGLPRGWTSQGSTLYQNPLQVTITADPNATEGNYSAQIVAINEHNGEQLGNFTFTVEIHVTYDVMSFAVSPNYLEVGPGQPARFAINITNTGATGDAFDVSATGAKRWAFDRQVFVPAESSKTLYYEIVGQEEQTYTTPIRVVSLASSKISGEQNVTLVVKSTLIGDWKATNDGVVVFPIFESLPYSIAGLISNFF